MENVKTPPQNNFGKTKDTKNHKSILFGAKISQSSRETMTFIFKSQNYRANGIDICEFSGLILFTKKSFSFLIPNKHCPLIDFTSNIINFFLSA